MPSSNSSVRGLSRVIRLEGPDESGEHMMRRVDRAEVAAICRHLVGDVRRTAGTDGTADLMTREPVR